METAEDALLGGQIKLTDPNFKDTGLEELINKKHGNIKIVKILKTFDGDKEYYLSLDAGGGFYEYEIVSGKATEIEFISKIIGDHKIRSIHGHEEKGVYDIINWKGQLKRLILGLCLTFDD